MSGYLKSPRHMQMVFNSDIHLKNQLIAVQLGYPVPVSHDCIAGLGVQIIKVTQEPCDVFS